MTAQPPADKPLAQLLQQRHAQRERKDDPQTFSPTGAVPRYKFLHEPQPQRHASHLLHLVKAEFVQAAFDFGAAQPCRGALQARDGIERRQLVDPHGHIEVRYLSLFRMQRDCFPETGKLAKAMV